MKRILLVEDDPEITLGLKDNLEVEGYEVLTAVDGEAGIDMAVRSRPHAIILDIMLPKVNGFDVCRSLRERGLHAPILMLTARGQEMDRVRGLELGADDYVTKPFGIYELIARVRAMMRRGSGKPTALDVYHFGRVEISFRHQRAHKAGKPLALSSLEFDVIRYLVERCGQVISREQLLRDIWGYESVSTTRSVDNLIVRLRQKLESDPHKPRHILTAHRTGYKFVD